MATGSPQDILDQVPPGFRPGLVILDTLARSMVGGDETGAAGMGVFIDNAERLGRTLKATIMPIHHMGKDVNQGMRGSSTLLGAADAIWEIDPEGRNELRLAKMKEGADDLRLTFALQRVVIDHDVEGDPITSCVVSIGPAAPDEAPAIAAPPPALALPAAGLVFLAALERVIEAHGAAVSARFRHIPADARVIRQSDLAPHADALAIIGSSEKSRRSIIDRHIRTLETQGLIARHAGFVWLPNSTPLTMDDKKPIAA